MNSVDTYSLGIGVLKTAAMASQRHPDKAMIGVWVHKDLKKQLSDIADDENRNLSNQVETILKNYLKKANQKGRTKAI